MPYPERTETQHTIVSGTTGSGKTVLIADLVAQIRARGERCIIYDKMGSYTQSFFDPERDVLLNPLDARSPRWSPFMEARNPRDFDMMAAALIPQQRDTVDPFWVTAARQLFSNGAAVLWKRGVKENRILVDHLLKTELNQLAEAMEGTVAQSIVDPENPKTALSVRAMLTAHIGALEFLPDTGKPFSIRDWVSRKDGGGFLFLTSRGDQHASLRGLISTWLEIAVNALLSLDQDGERRVWVILDELPTLHQVPSLQPGLAESRQFGGCFVLGIQVSSALRDLYGKNGAETISGLCGTRVVLSAPDRDTAQWSADSLGRAEIEEVSEAYSYGANTMRDGVSLTPRRELRSLALPSEIMRLPNLTGYLKLPGPWPVARIKLKYVHRPMMAARFVQRGELPPVENQPAVPAGSNGRDADPQASNPDARSKRKPDEEDAMPWSAGTAGNQRKSHQAPLEDKSNPAGTAANQVSLNLPPPGDAPLKDTGQTNGEEKAEIPAPAPDAENAPLPRKKKNLAAGDGESGEDEARGGDGNGTLDTEKPCEPETNSRDSAHQGEGMVQRRVVPSIKRPKDGDGKDRLIPL